MFCVTWFVTASSITDPMAESASHWSCVLAGRTAAGAALWACGASPFMESQAVPAQRSAKAAKTNDQPQPSAFRSSAGSNSAGNPRSASSEARLERANRRYGTTVRKRRQYHAWRRGVVVDSRSEEHTSELQSLAYLVCRLLLEKKK